MPEPKESSWRSDEEKYLPPSVPVYPGAAEPNNVDLNSSVEEREVAAAHAELDLIGVPRTLNKDIGDGKTAEHVLRVHGRLAMLFEVLEGKEIRLEESDFVDLRLPDGPPPGMWGR